MGGGAVTGKRRPTQRGGKGQPCVGKTVGLGTGRRGGGDWKGDLESQKRGRRVQKGGYRNFLLCRKDCQYLGFLGKDVGEKNPIAWLERENEGGVMLNNTTKSGTLKQLPFR